MEATSTDKPCDPSGVPLRVGVITYTEDDVVDTENDETDTPDPVADTTNSETPIDPPPALVTASENVIVMELSVPRLPVNVGGGAERQIPLAPRWPCVRSTAAHALLTNFCDGVGDAVIPRRTSDDRDRTEIHGAGAGAGRCPGERDAGLGA